MQRIMTRSGAGPTKSILSAAASQAKSLRTGSRPNANLKVRCFLYEPLQEKSREHDKFELQNAWTKWRYAGQRNRSNELPAIRDAWKSQVANRGPDGSPRHFCLRVQQRSGNNSDAHTRGRSGHGRSTRCPRVQR